MPTKPWPEIRDKKLSPEVRARIAKEVREVLVRMITAELIKASAKPKATKKHKRRRK